MKKRLFLCVLFLGSGAPLSAADYSAQEEAMLISLNDEPSPIWEQQISLHELDNYLTIIHSVRAAKGDPKLYEGLEELINGALTAKCEAMSISGCEASSEQEQEEPSFDLNITQQILDSLQECPIAISDPKTPIQELESYLSMIESIGEKEGDPSVYDGLKELIQSAKEARSRQAAPRPKKEKGPEDIQKEEATRRMLDFLALPSPFKMQMMNRYPEENLKSMIDYLWINGLVNDLQFRHIYRLLVYAFLYSSDQVNINNLHTFVNDAEYIQMPTDDNPDFGFYILNMNKVNVDGRNIVQLQRGLDCGFHAAFNGLELYRFAKGIIGGNELAELLPHFDVDSWKNDPRFACSGDSYIDSHAIDNILKGYGLGEEDYSILESIETYSIDMDIVQKLAITLFDPQVTRFTHVIIINSQARDHWTVAVVNKTDGQIRVYTADSLFGKAEERHIAKIMQLVSQVNVKEAEFDALMQINRTLSTLADVQRNESVIVNLLSLLPVVYQKNVTLIPYFLKNFQQPLLRYISAQLHGQPSRPEEDAGIVRRMLEQLKAVIETAELPNLPPLNFEHEYSTTVDKHAFVTHLELYRIQGRLHEALEHASAGDVANICDAIETVRIDVENNNALQSLQAAIPVGELPNIDFDNEYHTQAEMIQLLSQLEMYRRADRLEQLLQNNQEQIGNILTIIGMVRGSSNFRHAFDALEKVAKSCIIKKK